jgi:hypothetical protein
LVYLGVITLTLLVILRVLNVLKVETALPASVPQYLQVVVIGGLLPTMILEKLYIFMSVVTSLRNLVVQNVQMMQGAVNANTAIKI